MRKAGISVLLLSILVLLSGCFFLEEKEPSITLPFTFEKTSEHNLKTGKLIYTISSIHVISNIADIPEEGAVRSNAYIVCYDGEGNELLYDYPDLVQEDGSFAEGNVMVLVDVTVTSEGAEAWTLSDTDSKGNPKGLRSDPYVFDIQGTFDRAYPDNRPGHSLHYYSELEEGEDRDSAFTHRITPGESQAFTIGFFINDDPETGEPFELSKVFLRVNEDQKIPLIENDD